MLKRQGFIETWHDRRIAAGEEVDRAISRDLESADIILLLVSPDFLASDYCYDREMVRAMERHEKGSTTVIPVILRPCDWHDAPFGKLLAAPRDGKPITQWPDMDAAFLDVTTAIKDALRKRGATGAPAAVYMDPAGNAAGASPNFGSSSPQRAGAGRTPASIEITMRMKTPGTKIDDFLPVCALVLANTGENQFERCLVQVAELSGRVPDGMPLPLTLRTDSQIRSNERGPFALFARQEAAIPLAFHSPHRSNEWYLFDENGKRYFIAANPMKLLLRVYGGAPAQSALVFIDTDNGLETFSFGAIRSDGFSFGCRNRNR